MNALLRARIRASARLAAPMIAVTMLAAACDAPTVPPRILGYQFAFEEFAERVIYRWPDGHAIGVYVQPTGDADRDAMLENAFRHSASVWNDAVLFGEYRIEAADLERADVILTWSNQALPVDLSVCPPAPGGSAWTTFCADTALTAITTYPLITGEHEEDGIHMIVQILTTITDPDQVTALVAHEFGHVLGIGTHPCRLSDSGCPARRGAHDSLMFVGIPERSTPSAADRSTVELLYHTRPDLTP